MPIGSIIEVSPDELKHKRSNSGKIYLDKIIF